MSLPRQVVPGRVYLVTRRCTQRMFLLRPDQPTNDAFLYCLGFAAQRTEIEVVAFLAMSNHWHGVVVDRAGRLPEFLETFHKLVAKHQNALRGRWENVWASEQTSVVELVNPEDVISKVVYTLTNPVADHLVEKAHHWPGASSLRATLHGDVVEVARPRRFFRSDGPCPPAISLRCTAIPGFPQMSGEELAAHIAAKVAEVERAAAAERAETGRSVIGRTKILKQPWWGRPTNLEPRRQLDPRVACRNVWRRVETLGRNQLFVETYRTVRDLWRGGEKVLFPFGTYWLRRFAGAHCSQPDQLGPDRRAISGGTRPPAIRLGNQLIC
jgi:putative transposase